MELTDYVNESEFGRSKDSERKSLRHPNANHLQFPCTKQTKHRHKYCLKQNCLSLQKHANARLFCLEQAHMRSTHMRLLKTK